MTSNNSPEEPLSTTTVSSVLVEAGDCRIVIALLKCGKWVQLQLVESVPNVLEIGSNEEETKKLLHDHELLLAKLKPLEGHVWDLLREADKTAAEHQDEEQVYEAMAESLGDAWDSLTIVLEKRRTLLKLSLDFFENALEFAAKIDQVEDFLQYSQEFENPESLKELLHQHKLHTKELLEKSLRLLNKSHDLTEFIQGLKSDGPNINPEFIQGAHNSCLKIDILLEVLQDRRRQLDKYLKLQGEGLEQVLQICQWHYQENQITSWYKKNIKDYINKQNLGSSLKENEALLQEHKEMEYKVKEWNSSLQGLKSEALKILFSEEYAEKEHLKLSNKKMNLLEQEVNRCFEERKTLLQEANDFFIAARKAYDILENVEASLKLFESKVFNLPILAIKHEELQKEIKNGSDDVLQKGQALLSKQDVHSSWMIGIQERMDYIEKKVDQLIKQFPDHKEFASNQEHLATSLEDYLKKASTKIQNIGPVLSAAVNPGSSVPESEEVLKKYLELANQTKEMASELELAVRICKEMEELKTTEIAVFSNKTELLNEELAALNSNLSLKLKILKPYVAFLKSSDEVENDAQKLKEFYINEPAEDIEAKNEALLQSADVQWHKVLKKILSTQDMGHDFLNLVKMVNNNLIMNVENVVQVTERTLDILNKEKEELTELWARWKLSMNQVQSVKQQCGKFNEQFKNTTQRLIILQEGLRSTLALDLGSNFSVLMELQNKFNEIKPQFQQLNAEVEYTLKLSEQLSLKGVPDMVKSEKISELIHLHKEIKEMMAKYDEVFNKTVKFHKVREELEGLIKSGGLEILQMKDAPSDTSLAKVHLTNTQEKHIHIRHLYKLALSLGMDILSTVKHPNSFNVSVKNLQQQLDTMASDSINWDSKAEKYEEELSHVLHFCITRDEIHELRESFKDLRKKFNNMKFNYSKKTEKARNLKTLRIQIQQMDAFSEKYQVLRNKLENLKKKVLDSVPTQPSDKAEFISASVNELEKQLTEFGKIMEDYKKNLELMEHLQEMMEECQFWCEEASATVLRVGRYSTECKTREAVEILYKQFKKFIDPVVPQQEERIQQLTNLAKKLYGNEEGKKYVEKIAAKHKEVLDSVGELCSSLTELEDKLGEDSLRGKSSNSNKFDDELRTEEDSQKLKVDKEDIKEKVYEEEKDLAETSVSCPAVEDSISQDTELSSAAKEDSFHTELLAEDALSGDEYEYSTGSCQRQMATGEEIKSISEKNSKVSFSGQAPNFSKLLSNVTVMEGAPVTLEVEVTGFPEPTLTWYKKGQRVMGDEHIKLLHRDTQYTLFIEKVYDSDAGLYVVRAKNSSGTVSSSAILRVKVQGKQPNFTNKFGHRILKEGDDLDLHCTIHGEPRPNVIWTKDGTRMVAREINIEKLGDTYYLVKRNAVVADTGKYICLATNELGQAHCSAFIRVIEKNKSDMSPMQD
ncbi:coiled-coil domain-containing protein 141 isoform X7 [Crotalus tigris]|uniref:coiled-coil domain-containing protein 141 isoform X7 n=1 Tax=Crotalus tigris TaxID=88082 RepID=UPI00192FAD38|nr:coiled-coil domain-containing protein 141 isoform X7 [Crotalus tigris]